MPHMQMGISVLFLSLFLPGSLWAAPVVQGSTNTNTNPPSSNPSRAVGNPADKKVNSADVKSVGDKPAEKLPPIPVSLAGHWFNTENGATVGLIIQGDKTCEMYTERLTNPRSSRGCKVELYRDDTYLLYLKGADGQCGATADFEFRYLLSQQRLDLDTGGGAHFLLEKRQESPLPRKQEQ